MLPVRFELTSPTLEGLRLDPVRPREHKRGVWESNPSGHDRQSCASSRSANTSNADVRTRTCIARLSSACSRLFELHRHGSEKRSRTFNLRFQRPACFRLHHLGTKGDASESNRLTRVPQTRPAPFGLHRHQAGMKGLEPFNPGLKNLSRDRFAFIPTMREERIELSRLRV